MHIRRVKCVRTWNISGDDQQLVWQGERFITIMMMINMSKMLVKSFNSCI